MNDNAKLRELAEAAKMTDNEKLLHFGYADGNYQCACGRCGGKFLGDKRATGCKSCAMQMAEMESSADNTKLRLDEIDALRETEYGCHCDIETMPKGFKPDDCVISSGDIADCVYAREDMKPEECKYWKPIKGFSQSITADNSPANTITTFDPRQAEQEIEALKHDIARHMSINAEVSREKEALQAHIADLYEVMSDVNVESRSDAIRLMDAMSEDPAQSLRAIEQRVEREVIERCIKAVTPEKIKVGAVTAQDYSKALDIIRNLPTAYPGEDNG